MYNNSYESNFSGGIWSGIKSSFKQGSALTRLIYINIAIFLAIKVVAVLFVLAGQQGVDGMILPYLGVPALPERLLYTPWTIITCSPSSGFYTCCSTCSGSTGSDPFS